MLKIKKNILKYFQLKNIFIKIIALLNICLVFKIINNFNKSQKVK